MRRIPYLTFLAVALSVVPLVAWQTRPVKAPQNQQRSNTSTFTGVIDEKESDFVLNNSQSMELIAVLQGVGFGKDNFARFVGMPVEVRGVMVSTNGQKVLQVKSIDDVHRLPIPAQ